MGAASQVGALHGINMDNETLITLTADITGAYVANNRVASDEVGKLVQDIHQAISSLGEEQEEPVKPEPAVSVRSSIKPDYLVCLECGARQKILKRHLRVAHDLSPDEYRERFGLRSDYPLTAPEYSKRRGEMAKAAGLGRKKGEKPSARRKKKLEG